MNQDYQCILTNLLKEIYKKTAAVNQLESDMSARIATAKLAIESEYAVRIHAGKADIKRVEKTMQSAMRQYQHEFTAPDALASRSCEWGTYGWRNGGDKVKITNAAALAMYVFESPSTRRDCGTFTFKENKEGIKRQLQSGAEIPGCVLGGSNASFYTLADAMQTVKTEVKK